MGVALSLIPIVLVIILLFGFKMSSAKAGIVSMATTAIIALFYSPASAKPVEVAYASFHGLLISLVVLYVLLFGILLFHLMDEAGLIPTLSDFVHHATNDPARQVIILCVAFSPLVESVSGFGIGVIVVAPILVALGFSRFQAALLTLVSLNAVPWGALATGTVIGSNLTGLAIEEIGLGSAYLCIFTFFYFAFTSIYLLNGKKGIAEKWPELLIVSGALAFGVWVSNRWISVELSGAIGALFALAAEGLFLYFSNRKKALSPVSPGTGVRSLSQHAPIVKVLLPYFFLTCLLIISRVVPAMENGLTSFAVIKWEKYSYALPVLYSPGFFLFLTCVFTIFLFSLKKKQIQKALLNAVRQLKPVAISTIAFIVMAEIMSQANMTQTLAIAAGNVLGENFFWISPIIGGFGGMLTGSNTASNAMLIKMQVHTAQQFGLGADTIASIQNTSASHMTMASPSRVVLATAVCGNPEAENRLFRTVFFIAAGSLLIMMPVAVIMEYF